ncbi:MAG: hypothetical protein ABI771_03855 [Betaproteobacteria bacterium]
MAFLPGWNSIESAAQFHGIFEKAAIFMLMLFVVALVLSYAYGHRKDYLNDEAMRAAAEDRQATTTERQLADAERQIAEVAREKERAEEVALVQKQQLSEAQGRLDQARKEVKAAAARPDEIIQPQDDARPRADARSDSDRRLTDGQRARLRAFLEKQEKGNLVIKANPFVLDAHTYGQQIGETFKQLGWAVRLDNEKIAGSDVTGMWFTLRGAESIPVGTGALHAALEHAQIPVGTQPRWDPNGPQMNQIWLVIGKSQ